MKRYSNPRGLYAFQAKSMASCILRKGSLGVIDAGLGKTHIALGAAGFLLDEEEIDSAIFVVENNKIEEWVEDFDEFTEMDLHKFHGKKRNLDDDSEVFLTTYHTLRDALTVKHPSDKRSKSRLPGPGIEKWRGKNILLVLDEAAILGTSRTSGVYTAFEMALREWRKADANVYVMALTATPMSSSPVNFYNLGRLLRPDLMPSVKDFMSWYVVKTDSFGRPKVFKNLDNFEAHFSPILVRKRKTDDDVKDEFPSVTEKFVSVNLSLEHMRAYGMFDDFIKMLPEGEQAPGYNALNAFAQHPATVLHSGWERALEWAYEYGEERILRIGSVKCQTVIDWAASSIHSPGGHIIFSDSNNALERLAEEIDDRFEFVEFHGRKTDAQNREAKARFRAGEAKVMLASAKAERGINLPEAWYITNYSTPRNHGSYIQRLNRGSRIGSNAGGILTVKTFTSSRTIEESTLRTWMRRNEWSDVMQDTDVEPDDPEFISAVMRKQLIRDAEEAG